MKLTKTLSLLSALLISTVSYAEYQLDSAASSINFTSIKKTSIAEVHSFKKISGTISPTGLAQLSVNLDSVETNIAIRNQRMQTMLFETSLYPDASVSAQLDSKQLAPVTAGQSLQLPVEFTFELHGATKSITSTVSVLGLAGGGLQVNSIQPIILNAADFALLDGIQKLMIVANLPAIASAVPLTFNLVFKPI